MCSKVSLQLWCPSNCPAVLCGRPDQPKVAFVVENSGVFSEILDRFGATRLQPIVCAHGQFKLACLMLLDKLAAAGITIYYSGDFDPEGLQMASRLLQRYPGQAVPWRYTVDDYGHCVSEVTLSGSCLKRVDTSTIHSWPRCGTECAPYGRRVTKSIWSRLWWQTLRRSWDRRPQGVRLVCKGSGASVPGSAAEKGRHI